ncbi:hypothetical protein HAX54_048030 [Datura stramonium]|uniref:Uncharacterized protein n=1 Tax=Datura stramonium TaxID=4076 RepID=A0ABS8STR8_DATST|nr:hypothetical protein [Datura stramonium]
MAAKQIKIVAIDDTDHSFYALEWTLYHSFGSTDYLFKLIIVHIKTTPTSVVAGMCGYENLAIGFSEGRLATVFFSLYQEAVSCLICVVGCDLMQVSCLICVVGCDFGPILDAEVYKKQIFEDIIN